MRIITTEGILPSKLWCKECRTTLISLDTRGIVTQSVRQTLEGGGVKHEQRHPKHNPEITYYKLPEIRGWDEVEDGLNPLLLGC